MRRCMPFLWLYLPVFGALSLLLGDLLRGGMTALFLTFCFVGARILTDRRDGWYYLAFTLPDGRRKTVRCYYTLDLIMQAVVYAVILLAALIIDRIGMTALPSLLWVLMLWFSIHMLTASLLYPLLIHFSARKKRCAILSLTGTLCSAALTLYATAFLGKLANEAARMSLDLTATLILGFGIASAVSCIMYIASYLFAASLMKRKEIL